MVTRQWALIEFPSDFFSNVHYTCNTNLLFVVLLSTEIENVTSFAELKGSFYRHIDQEEEEKQIHNLQPSRAARRWREFSLASPAASVGG